MPRKKDPLLDQINELLGSLDLSQVNTSLRPGADLIASMRQENTTPPEPTTSDQPAPAPIVSESVPANPEKPKAPTSDQGSRKIGRPRKHEATLTPAERARLSRQRRSEQIAQAMTTGDLRDVDDKTLATLLARSVGHPGQRALVRHCLKELNRRFGVEPEK